VDGGATTRTLPGEATMTVSFILLTLPILNLFEGLIRTDALACVLDPAPFVAVTEQE
jgi:hypothetical protein